MPANLRVGLELVAEAVLAFAGGVRLRLLEAPRDGAARARPLSNGHIAEGEAATFLPA